MIVAEFSFVLGALLMLALAGFALVLPFRLRYSLLAAPFAGVVTSILGIALLYGVLGLSFASSVLVTMTGGAILTAVAVPIARREQLFQINRADIAVQAALLIAVCGACVATVDAATLIHRQAAFFIGDGADHPNYAHVADWMVRNRLADLFVRGDNIDAIALDLISGDHRLGAYYFLAFISYLSDRPALFSWDLACALVLACALLGVAGVFARKPMGLLLLLLGLAVSVWFDFTRLGFLAKVINYPGSMMIVGLLFCRQRSILRLPALVALTMGVASSHSGLASALLVGTCGVAMLAMQTLMNRQFDAPRAVHLACLIATCIATTGILSRPIQANFPDWNVPWSFVLVRILDLDNQGLAITGLPATWVYALCWVGFTLWLASGILAAWTQNAEALGILAGMALLLLAMLLSGRTAACFQLMGVFYPLTLVGIVMVLDGLSERGSGGRAIVLYAVLIAATAIAIRVPRVIGGLDRYVFHQGWDRVYTQGSFDELTAQVGSESILVAVDQLYATRVLRTELLRRLPGRVYWTETAWRQAAMSGRTKVPFDPASHSRPTKFAITSRASPPPDGAAWREVAPISAMKLFRRD